VRWIYDRQLNSSGMAKHSHVRIYFIITHSQAPRFSHAHDPISANMNPPFLVPRVVARSQPTRPRHSHDQSQFLQFPKLTIHPIAHAST
jgi:hypothetical protein